MHLSRWNTMEICARTFMCASLSVPLRFTLQFVDNHVRVTIGGRRSVVVKAIAILRIASGHEYRLEPHTGDTVGPSTAAPPADWGLGERNGPFGCMVENADAARNARAHHGASYDHAVVVVCFHPIVVENADLRGIFVIQPERLDAARKSEHP